MKLKILGASHHIITAPACDAQGQPTGSKEAGLLELIMIPAGDDPQHACMRFNVQIYAPDDASLLKFRPTTILDMAEISTAAAEAANAAYFAPPKPPLATKAQEVPIK